MIINRKNIELNPTQIKMIKSGWGEEAYENSVVEKITYQSDGLKVKGYLAQPQNLNSEKYPCIIWNRGGYLDKGAIDTFTARGIFGQIASWGYCVFASQYRGNAGGEGKEEIGGEDINDVLNLLPLADEIEKADKSSWGIEGWSRGGMMTFLTLQRNQNFKCAVLVGAISNLTEIAEMNKNTSDFYRKIIGADNFDKEVNKRSAINFAEKLPKIPFLLLHGADDKTVPSAQSEKLSERFNELGIPHQLKVFEEGDHYLKNHREEVTELKRKWYEKYL